MFELLEIQAVETDQTLVRTNPEIAVWGLFDGRYRALKAFFSSPRVTQVLQYRPVGIDS